MHRTTEDIPVLQHRFCEAIPRYLEHRSFHLFRRRHVAGSNSAQQGKERRKHGIQNTIEPRLRANPVHRLDVSRPKQVHRAKGKREQRVFRTALNSRPHGAALLRAVCALAGDVDERHRRIDAHEHARRCHGRIESHPRVGGLRHASGAHAEAEEAGVEAGQSIGNRLEVPEVVDPQLSDLCVGATERPSHNCEYLGDIGRQQTLPQHTLPHHAACAKQDHSHRLSSSARW